MILATTDNTFFHPGLSALELEAFDGLRAAQKLAHETATNAGWYIDPESGKPIERNFGEVLMLMVSELAEALEADRKGKRKDDKLPWRDAVEVELADCVIRIFDTAAARGYDMAAAIIDKNAFNRTRSDHKLENRKAESGKKY